LAPPSAGTSKDGLELAQRELVPELVRWNRTHLAALHDDALSDPRCEVVTGNVFTLLKRSRAASVGSAGVSPRFERRLVGAGFTVEVLKVSAYQGSRSKHVLFVGMRTTFGVWRPFPATTEGTPDATPGPTRMSRADARRSPAEPRLDGRILRGARGPFHRWGDEGPGAGVVGAGLVALASELAAGAATTGTFVVGVARRQFVERILTTLMACRQQDRKVLDFLVAARSAALNGTPAPSLVPRTRSP
jgi:hypothetical protein